MQLGLIGLGKMGANMAERLRRDGHQVVGFDRSPQAPRDVDSLPGLVAALSAPRVVWVMVPAGEPTRATVTALGDLLSAGDIIIDGGNSEYVDDREHAAALAPKGIRYLDCGVSGGVWGITEGYALMVGGDPEAVAVAMPIFDSLKPPAGGFVHAGPVGAGHFVKMIHNGIEYGIMQAYAEGYEILAAREDLITDVSSVFQAWQRGTVVRSWLLELLVKALNHDDDLSEIKGYVADSGEGRWTVQEAIDLAVPAPVISASLFARFDSRQEDSPAMKAVAALREQFGG
ncbi:MAG TPA: decarboxylating 6-phosphogluconate dehydrogenase, partial [Nakamurella sp.]